MQITPSNLDFLFNSLQFAFNTGVNRAAPNTYWKDIATEVPSGSAQNVYPFISQIPGLREWIGPRVVNNIAGRSYTLPNKHFEATVDADRNVIEDDQYGLYTPIADMIGQQVAEFPDRKLAETIEAGTTELCWDGQFFFDTDHPVDPDNAGAGTNSNKLVGAGYDIAVADPLVPFAAARALMAAWKREDGKTMGTYADTIMVHPNEEKYGLQIVEAVNTAQAVSSAAAGVSNVFRGKVKLIVNPFLTVTSGRPWYLLATNGAIKPFIRQVRKSAEFVAMTNTSDSNVFYQRKFVWGTDLREGHGYSFAHLAFRMSAS